MSIDLPADLLARLDAWGDEHGKDRGEAAAALLDTALRIGDVDGLLNRLTRQTLTALFNVDKDAEDAIAQALTVVHEEATASWSTGETHPDRPQMIVLSAYRARAHWIIETEIHDPASDDPATYDVVVLGDDVNAAIVAFEERLIALTDGHWSPADGYPLWWENVHGDRLGYGDPHGAPDSEGGITWRGLIPEAAVLTAEELAADHAQAYAEVIQEQLDDQHQEEWQAHLEAVAAEQGETVYTRICPHCRASAPSGTFTAKPHRCPVAKQIVPEPAMIPGRHRSHDTDPARP